MIIRFLQNTTLQIIEGYDEKTEQVEEVEQHFQAGEKADADILQEGNQVADLQFADGSVTFNVPRSLFEIVSDCA